jgi:hypothetical protein
MAYNTLTGTVNFSNAVRGAIESMVDDYSTQAIGGTKSFTSTLSASAFRSEAGDIVPPALTAIAGDSAGRLIVSDGDGTATCDATLVFSSTSLTASYFSGSARGLTALPIGGANVDGQLSASNLYYGAGLTSNTNQLEVSGGEGISTADGVTVDMATNGGLGMTSSKLRVDPYDGTAKASLSNNDQFLISDSDSSNVLKSSTMTVLKTYMQDGLTFSTPGGSDNTVQTKSGTSFAGSSNLTFDGTTLTLAGGLTASVNISASAFYGDGSNLSGLSAGAVSSYTNSGDNRIITSVNSSTINGEANLTFDGSTLTVTGDSALTGSVTIDKDHTNTTAATITGLEIDFDKTGASTSNNTMYGLNIDMDNTTATDGSNFMYGIRCTPTLAHAAAAGTPIVYGAFIAASSSTNGTSLAQAARFEAAGADINYGIVIDCEDGGTDLRIESSADNGDYFQIQTTTHGATTVTTYDDDAMAAHLVFDVDGDITLEPAAGTVDVIGNLTASINISASAFYGDATRLSYPGNTSEVAFYSDGLMAGDGGWLFVTGAGGSETHTIVVDTQFSSSQNLSASVFYGDGSKLTGISAGASTGSGGEGEIQFMRSTDGAFASNGALSFKTGSSGAAGASLTCSNLVVTHGVKLPYAVKTANYTLLVSDNVIYMSGNANNLTASLPAAATVDGTVYYIKNISKHRETEIDPNGSEKIEYTSSVSIGEGEGMRIQALEISTGVYAWQIIGTAMPLP